MNEGGLLSQQEEKEFTRRYRFSLWWVEHRVGLRRIGIGCFIFFDALLLLIGGYFLLDAFALSSDAESREVYKTVVLNQADLNAYTRANRANDLDVESERVLSVGGGKYDLLGIITNPNSDWWAKVDYHFTYRGGETSIEHQVILPHEKKILSVLGIESTSPVSDVNLIIDEMTWHRVDHTVVKDIEQWKSDRLKFIVTNPLFENNLTLGEKTYGRVSFSVKNDTAFSYYEPLFIVLLKKGTTIVGVNTTTISDFESGETADISLNWFGVLPSVTSIEVLPQISLFDFSVYKPLEGESTRDTRTRVMGVQN